MSEQNLISVIIPVYNAENTIENSVKSVLLSSHSDIEIILVDDGSTDGSSAVCDKLSMQHKNISAYHIKNTGAAGARNFGIEHANGNYISFVDSDDFITNNYFEVLLNILLNSDADIAVCGHRKIYGKHDNLLENEVINYTSNYSQKEEQSAKVYSRIEALKGLLYQRSFISAPWGMISKKELFENLRFPVGKRAEDMATIYKLFAAANKVVRTDIELYLYYQNKSGTIYTTQSTLNPDYYAHCKDMVEFIKNNYPEALKAAKSRMFSACFQILSETPVNAKDQELIHNIYNSIKELRFGIIFDMNGKPRNRCAALISIFSIPLLHRALNSFYLYRLKKL